MCALRRCRSQLPPPPLGSGTRQRCSPAGRLRPRGSLQIAYGVRVHPRTVVMNMTFTPGNFRKALGVFPTGVAVVTARAPDGRLLGTTVSSFNSVSLDPPLVLFSLAHT